ncbi:hypothetical protein ACLOJK_041844 [Asimina triloba]
MVGEESGHQIPLIRGGQKGECVRSVSKLEDGGNLNLHPKTGQIFFLAEAFEDFMACEKGINFFEFVLSGSSFNIGDGPGVQFGLVESTSYFEILNLNPFPIRAVRFELRI